jgi:S1-C subfamily serine protease
MRALIAAGHPPLFPRRARAATALLCLLAAVGGAGQPPRAAATAATPRTVEARVGAAAVRVAGDRLLGSGALISADGWLLTAAHVSGETGRCCRITLADGREFTARVAASDPGRDVALLAIDGARGLPCLPLGDSDRLGPGQALVCGGYPHGAAAPTVSAARVRENPDPRRPLSAASVCTDAVLAPGDSGGPLADRDGRLVGIHLMVGCGRGQVFSLHCRVNALRSTLSRRGPEDLPGRG